jgi:hypothetical protein
MGRVPVIAAPTASTSLGHVLAYDKSGWVAPHFFGDGLVYSL